MDFLLQIFAGAAVGLAIGLTGVGGGSLMTPLLLLFGYPPSVAIGTDLLYASLTKLGGVISHQQRRNIDWNIVVLLGSGSIPGSILIHIYFLDPTFQASGEFEEVLTFSLGLMLIITSIILIIKNKLGEYFLETEPGRPMAFIHKNRSFITWSMGLILGGCVTLSSVGAGALGAAILLTIYSQSQTVKVVGTDIAHAVPLTFVAGLGYMIGGYVDLILLLSLLMGSLPAIYWGSRLSTQVPDEVLKKILIVVLFGLGGYYSLIINLNN